jgi:EAL domain-containing protein (putative c-di-GMP-specific phosphodiesterase class I)
VKQAQISPDRVVFEITERSAIQVETIVRESNRLRSLGFRIALDDVGAGNMGLEVLRHVPVDFVKIDRSLISQALVDNTAHAVLSGILAFARRAGTFVIAEGIETRAMLDMVEQAGLPSASGEGGVHGAQGYLFGRPSQSIAHDRAGHGGVLTLRRGTPHEVA